MTLFSVTGGSDWDGFGWQCCKHQSIGILVQYAAIYCYCVWWNNNVHYQLVLVMNIHDIHHAKNIVTVTIYDLWTTASADLKSSPFSFWDTNHNLPESPVLKFDIKYWYIAMYVQVCTLSITICKLDHLKKCTRFVEKKDKTSLSKTYMYTKWTKKVHLDVYTMSCLSLPCALTWLNSD